MWARNCRACILLFDAIFINHVWFFLLSIGLNGFIRYCVPAWIRRENNEQYALHARNGFCSSSSSVFAVQVFQDMDGNWHFDTVYCVAVERVCMCLLNDVQHAWQSHFIHHSQIMCLLLSFCLHSSFFLSLALLLRYNNSFSLPIFNIYFIFYGFAASRYSKTVIKI